MKSFWRDVIDCGDTILGWLVVVLFALAAIGAIKMIGKALYDNPDVAIWIGIFFVVLTSPWTIAIVWVGIKRLYYWAWALIIGPHEHVK